MSAFEVLSVECPRFERVPKASVATVGAVAVVSAKAGLIALLDSPVAGGQHLLGSGYQAPLTVPFGIAVSAAIGALGMPDPMQDRWMVRSAAIRWLRSARHDDVVRARARLVRLSPREAIVEVRAGGNREAALLETEIRLVPMRQGRYAAIDPDVLGSPAPASRRLSAGGANEGEGDSSRNGALSALLQARPIRIIAAGRSSGIEFQPDVVRLLMRPLAGRAEPLGRRVHPLGQATLGAALTVGLLAAGESDPDRPARHRIVRVDATWYSPLPPNEPWRARVRPHDDRDAGKVIVDVLTSDGLTMLAATVHWSAA